MGGSRSTTFVMLLAVSWAVLIGWAAAFLSIGAAAGFLAPILPFVVGAAWGSFDVRRVTFVWPAVITVALWQVLLFLLFIVLTLPLLGAAAGAHTGFTRGIGQLAPAVPLLLVGLAITWGLAGWLVRSVPACVPSTNAANMSIFAVVVVAAVAFGTLRWQTQREIAPFVALKEAAVATDSPVAPVKTSAGYYATVQMASDQTQSSEARAQAVAELFTTYQDRQIEESYSLASRVLPNASADARLTIVGALPSTPYSYQSVPLLGSMLQDPDPRVRMRASIKLVSINRQRHEQWDPAYREMQTLLQTLPENPSIEDEDVRCALYRLSITAEDMTPLLDYILEDTALPPGPRQMMTDWRDFRRDPDPNKVAPREFYDGCA